MPDYTQEEIFEKLADPDFDVNSFDWDQKVKILSYLIESKETYQKVVAGLAASLPDDKPGRGSQKHIAKLAQAIEDATGRKIAIRTLYKYRQAYKALEAVQRLIPADWPFRAWIYLSREENPQDWVKRGVDEGWSGAELVRELILSHPPETRMKICPRCSAQYKFAICPTCGDPVGF